MEYVELNYMYSVMLQGHFQLEMVSRDALSPVCGIFFLSSQKCYTFCHRLKLLYIFTFICFKRLFRCFTTKYILGVFHYFSHHGRPASQIFKPRLSFNYLNPAIILIFKNCALGILRYGLGQKQQRLVIVAT